MERVRDVVLGDEEGDRVSYTYICTRIRSTGNGAQVARWGEPRQLRSANMAVVTQVTKPANDIAAFEPANKY